MVSNRTQPNSNPLLLFAIRREERRPRLRRCLGRIWEQPEFLIEPSVKDAFSFLIEERLSGNRIKPDIFIIDLEDGSCSASALLETARLAPGLRHAPFIALLDDEDAGLRDQIYDAGADLVLPWSRLEARVGDIAGLVVGNWLNTKPDDDEQRQAG
ncbi:MAG: hypothetical protein ACE5FM_03455 [Methyloligellaceae bacterium]